MTGMGPRLTGLLCEDDPLIRRAVLVVMSRCGFESVSVVGTGREAVEFAGRTPPQVAVVDLALAGARGLGVVADIVRAAPRCNVVVVSPFAALGASALAAGAFAVCQLTDLRELQLCLQHALAHAAASCDACDGECTVELGPSAPFQAPSIGATDDSGYLRRRYRPWPAN